MDVMEIVEMEYCNESEAELKEFKNWLFKENMRLAAERKELEDWKDRLMKERSQFQSEIKALQRKLTMEEKRLKQETLFFDKKMQILQDGFRKLEADRKMQETEWKRIQNEKKYLEEDQGQMAKTGTDLGRSLFCGVKNSLTLKKRYKDLLKIFHPDNLAGDHEMVLVINKEYERLKQELELIGL